MFENKTVSVANPQPSLPNYSVLLTNKIGSKENSDKKIISNVTSTYKRIRISLHFTFQSIIGFGTNKKSALRT